MGRYRDTGGCIGFRVQDSGWRLPDRQTVWVQGFFLWELQRSEDYGICGIRSRVPFLGDAYLEFGATQTPD